MKEVVIAGYLRTAQSRSRPNDPARDWFCKLRADELLAKLLPEVIRRTGIDAKEIDDFLVGCATAVGEQWAYGGRMPIFLADLPETIPAKFVDQQCGSAMAGIHVGFMEIAMDFADEILPIEAEQADGSMLKVDQDQAVREDATAEGMADLKPVFKKDGVITPGNSSPLNAGAIGHALGATGIRLVGTLARILSLKGGRYGCANACVGGGQGVATVIEREVYDW